MTTLQDDAHAPGGEQRLQWSIVDPLDDAAFDDQPEKPDHNKGDRYREEGIAAELADHGGGIGADHDQLAVRHVDDAGNAEDDRETESCDHQDRDYAEAAEKLGDDRLKHSAPARRARLVPSSSASCGGADRRPRKRSAARAGYKSIVPERFFSALQGFFTPIEHALVGEVAGLVRIEVRHPRLRADPVFRFPHHVELALLVAPCRCGPTARCGGSSRRS